MGLNLTISFTWCRYFPIDLYKCSCSESHTTLQRWRSTVFTFKILYNRCLSCLAVTIFT